MLRRDNIIIVGILQVIFSILILVPSILYAIYPNKLFKLIHVSCKNNHNCMYIALKIA